MLKKRGRKLFLLFVGFWLLIIIIGAIINFMFRDKVIQLLKSSLDEHLLTEIYIPKDDVHFSVFKRFSSASIELNNVLVKSPYSFDHTQFTELSPDTLLFAKRIYLELSLIKLIGGEYELKKIEIADGSINILTDSKGLNNLKIWNKTKTDSARQVDIQLEKFALNKVNLVYLDKQSDLFYHQNFRKANMSGSLHSKKVSLKIKGDGICRMLQTRQTLYLKDEAIDFSVSGGFSDKKLSIQHGNIKIGNLPLDVNGTILLKTIPTLNLNLKAQKVALSKLNIHPIDQYISKSGFEPKKGSLDLNVVISGDTKPAGPGINFTFRIQNGNLKHTKLNKKIDKLFIDGSYTNGNKRRLESSEIQIDTISFRSGKSYLYGKCAMTNLVNPSLKGNFTAPANVSDLKSFFEKPGLPILEGAIYAKISFDGKLASLKQIKAKDLLNLNMSGEIDLHELHISSAENRFPESVLSGHLSLLSANTIQIDSLNLNTGSSDFFISGTASHVLSANYLNNFPRYKLMVYSEYMNVQDLLVSGMDSKEAKDKEFSLPDSLHMNLTFTADEFEFGKFAASQVTGKVNYTPKTMEVRQFSMQSCQGQITSSMNITEKSDHNIYVEGVSNLVKVDINDVFNSFNNFGQDVIQSKHLKGKLSGNVQFISAWNSKLKFLPGKIGADCKLTIDQGELIDYPPMYNLSKYLRLEELKHIRFDQLNTSISISNKTVFFDETTINSSVADFSGLGTHTFDNHYSYHLQVALSDLLWNKANKKNNQISEFGYIKEDGLGRTMLPLIITGQGTEFDAGYDKKAARKKVRESLKNEKKELKELFNLAKKTDLETESADSGMRDIKTEDKKANTQVHKSDSGIIIKSDEMMIQWDDGDEEEDDQ